MPSCTNCYLYTVNLNSPYVYYQRRHPNPKTILIAREDYKILLYIYYINYVLALKVHWFTRKNKLHEPSPGSYATMYLIVQIVKKYGIKANKTRVLDMLQNIPKKAILLLLMF